ncbi:hypothetical protein, partial [Rhodopirellula bahusiensis]
MLLVGTAGCSASAWAFRIGVDPTALLLVIGNAVVVASLVLLSIFDAVAIRYLIVELIAAGIFASLFLVELVTGAANVPGFQHYAYTGILWIILYTKWP